jgi:hypothetical protein
VVFSILEQNLVGAVIRVGDNSNKDTNPACGSPITLNQVNAGSVVEVACNLRGRYISIHLPGTQQLTLCEVKAYLGKYVIRTLVSKITSSSST